MFAVMTSYAVRLVPANERRAGMRMEKCVRPSRRSDRLPPRSTCVRSGGRIERIWALTSASSLLAPEAKCTSSSHSATQQVPARLANTPLNRGAACPGSEVVFGVPCSAQPAGQLTNACQQSGIGAVYIVMFSDLALHYCLCCSFAIHILLPSIFTATWRECRQSFSVYSVRLSAGV